MPRRCSVFGCRSNYDTEEKTTPAFSLPTNNVLRQKWLRNIPTDLSKLKTPIVCLEHFEESCIIRVDRVIVKGEMKEYPRERVKLSENAVPTIFKNAPAYCTKTAPKVKRLVDVEEEQMQQAIRDSIQCQSDYVQRNRVSSVNDIIVFLESRNVSSSRWTLMKHNEKLFICVLDIDSGAPCVTSYLTIYEDLSFDITVKNVKISTGSVSQIKTITTFNTLETLLTKLENNDVLPETKDSLNCAIQLLKSVPNYDDCEHLKFIVEQITLSQVQKNNRQYGNSTMILASCLYIHSASAYSALRKFGLMFFPHPRTIQRLICSYELCSSSLESSSYLENRVKNLKDHELTVSLLMDEIYIKPELTFKGMEIYGGCTFDAQKSAKKAQVFMVSSLFSKYVDVVAIIPVSNLNSEALKTLILKVLELLEKTGFKVLSLIADNNSVNRKAYELLTPNNMLLPSVEHPLDPSRRLFFMFDTVHILKCIRNNWETKRDRIINFPDINNFDCILTADYRHLELVYEKEKDSLIKYGHTLSPKVLYPSCIQKQNIKLALRIFNDNNVVALKHVMKDLEDLTPQISETAEFLNIILQFWKVVNVHSVFEGKRFNDPLRESIKSTSDMQFQFLRKLCHWLKMWRVSVPSKNSLSPQTFQSLIVTLESFLEVIPYVFDNYRVNYLLLGKFQTDNLESRFGKYRQLSGANYYISYIQVLENERKLRFHNNVLFAAENVGISLKSLLPSKQNHDSTVDVSPFTNLLQVSFEIAIIPSNVLPIVTYLGGFAARQTSRISKCDICCQWLQLDKEVEVDSSYDFVKDLDRGKLILPTEKVVFAVGLAWHTMTLLVKEFLQQFLTCGHQLALVHKISCMKLKESGIEACSCDCVLKSTLLEKLEYVLLCSARILINNFVRFRNDGVRHAIETKRKVKKFKC